ncbi:hypothetical protein PsWM33_01215 [Pseudovibrio sp. WM33]|nr:hypothetical protein PsWM33_01215 [Pseudovibrio sp. WM33]
MHSCFRPVVPPLVPELLALALMPKALDDKLGMLRLLLYRTFTGLRNISGGVVQGVQFNCGEWFLFVFQWANRNLSGACAVCEYATVVVAADQAGHELSDLNLFTFIAGECHHEPVMFSKNALS